MDLRSRCLRSEGPGLLVVLASLAGGVALTWQRWGGPLIDCGREMNQPLRLLQGESLYGDVSHIYGPLAPLVNAALYRLFGASLDTLRAGGLVATLFVLAVTYWLARRLMGRAAAALGAVSVTWLCALSFAGNYILPYAYAAVYGTALSLMAMAVALRSLRSGPRAGFLASGLLTALALLAKTEMGVAALAAGVVAALLAGAARRRDAVLRAAVFLLAALLPPMAVYVWIGAHVGWRPLLDEGHLLYQNLPPPIVVFNQRMFGLDQPGHALLVMLVVGLRLAFVASLLSWLAMWRQARHHVHTARLRGLTAGLAVAAAVSVLAVGWQGGPYLAAPLLLLMLIAFCARRLWQRLRSHGHAHGRAALLLVIAVFALTSLARMILRVRSGGSYSSYLLPAAVVIFTYAWCGLLPALTPAARARRLVRLSGMVLLTCWMLGVAWTTVHRYRTRHTQALATHRGVIVTPPDVARAFTAAMAFIEARTRPGDYVAILPEGTALLFFSDRRNPLHEEITVPGFLYEDRAMHTLTEKPVALVLVADRPTPEYGPTRFGVDYGQRLMSVIQARFARCGRLPAASADASRARALSFEAYCAIGDRPVRPGAD